MTQKAFELAIDSISSDQNNSQVFPRIKVILLVEYDL